MKKVKKLILGKSYYKQELFQLKSFVCDKKDIRNLKNKPWQNHFSMNTDKNFNEDKFLSFLIQKINNLINIELFRNETIIAGGFVLGAFLEYTEQKNNLSRDLDIFINTFPEENDEDLNSWMKNNGDLYRFYERSDNYEIISSKRKGFVNEIKFTSGKNFNWHTFIKDFDLNCVQIGICKKQDDWILFYSDEFLDFVNNKEIIIMNHEYSAKKVFRSIARAERKRHQYNINFDLYYFLNSAILQSLPYFKNNQLEYDEGIGVDNVKLLKTIYHPNINFSNENISINYYSFKEFNILKKFYLIFLENNKAFLSKKEIRRLESLSVCRELCEDRILMSIVNK